MEVGRAPPARWRKVRHRSRGRRPRGGGLTACRRLAALGLTTVVAAQPQRVAVGHRQAVGVAEAAHGVAVAVDHRAQLAVSALTKFKAEC